MSGEPKSRVESRHWIEAAMKPEHEFIEERRQMLLADAVVSAHQPCLQIREGDVDHRQMCVRFRAIAVEHHRFMRIPQSVQAIITIPSVGAYHGAWRHAFLHKPRERRGTPIGHETQAQSSGAQSLRSFFAVLAEWSWPYLDGADHRHLMMNTAPFARGATTYQRFIHLDRPINADRISIRAQQASG